MVANNDGPIEEIAYLKTCDFEGRSGRGTVVFTANFRKAKVFASIQELMTFWRTESKTVPLRTDGKPNRPLTAWTVEPVRL